jgi:hypothetical protein
MTFISWAPNISPFEHGENTITSTPTIQLAETSTRDPEIFTRPPAERDGSASEYLVLEV